MNWRLLFCIVVAGLLPLLSFADTLIVAGDTQRLSAHFITLGEDVFVPVVPALRLLGAKVTTHQSSISIISPNGSTINMTIGATRAVIDGKHVTMPAPPCLVGEAIYLPAKWLAPLLHATVRNENAGQTISLQPQLDVRFEQRPDGLVVLVRNEGGLQFHYREQKDGACAYIDFMNADLGEKERIIPVNTGRLLRIRLAQFHLSPATVRMSLDFSDPSFMTTTVGYEGRLLTIHFVAKQVPIIPTVTNPIAANTIAPPPAMFVPVNLISVALKKHSIRQSELLINTDGPTKIGAVYDKKARQLTLTVGNGTSQLDSAVIADMHDEIVSKVEAVRNAKTLGTNVVISLRQDAGYFVEQDAKDIRVFLGSFDISDMTIVLDPGHGDKDTGAIGVNGTMEKDINLAVALQAAKVLRSAGAKVLLTREDDTFIPLDDRPALANDCQASIFIAIHCNSTPTPNSASGTQTYYRTPQSAILAAAMHSVLIQQLGLNNGGVHVANFLVIRKCEMPSILLELAFLNNTDEEALLTSSDFQQKVADAILSGVRAYSASKDWQTHKGDGDIGHTAVTVSASDKGDAPIR